VVASRLIGLVALAISSFAAYPAVGLEFALSSNGDAIKASGEFVRNDVAKFKSIVSAQKKRPSVVLFNSRGGLLSEGIALGVHLRAEGFATRLGPSDSCASACVFAFVGGVVREVDKSGKVGVHMASLAFVDEYVAKLKKVLLDQSLGLDQRIRFIIAINEQSAATAARLEANHLIKMGISLRILEPLMAKFQDDMHWLTRREMLDYNVINVGE
jgi:hypothetical protein